MPAACSAHSSSRPPPTGPSSPVVSKVSATRSSAAGTRNRGPALHDRGDAADEAGSPQASEPRAAEWISDSLGKIEVERLKESRTPGFLADSQNFTLEIATKPLIMASEIADLPPLRAYIKQDNRGTPVRFAFEKKRVRQPAFVERKEPPPAPHLEPEVRTPEDVAHVARQLPIVQAPEEVDTRRIRRSPERPQPLKPAFKERRLEQRRNGSRWTEVLTSKIGI